MVIVINRKDGGVSILRPTSEAFSAELEVGKWCEIHVDQYVSHYLATEDDIPKRKNRDAWTDKSGKIKVDRDKVVKIALSSDSDD